MKHLPDWLPGTGFKREAKSIREYADRMLNEPLDLAIKRMVRPTVSFSALTATIMPTLRLLRALATSAHVPPSP